MLNAPPTCSALRIYLTVSVGADDAFVAGYRYGEWEERLMDFVREQDGLLELFEKAWRYQSLCE